LLNKDSHILNPALAFQYSNSGFCVLEQIVEIASGLSFQQFMELNVFKPLGMHNTRIFQAG
jgi:CubicO group peptidase (beta-lactamase class C family)